MPVKYLFVGGPPRSGTTALVHYLNRHPAVLLCMERYKWLPAREVGPDLFSFERILDYRPRPRGDRLETNTPREYHEELLASKDPARLEWKGDKAPGYVERLDVLAENNPGASFILTYRPLEEVAESFEARSRDPEDPWLGGREGFRIGTEHWNAAMRHTRDFVESAANLNVLVVSYHDFFRDVDAAIPQLARFLGVEFGPEIRESWGEMSRGFEKERRSKRTLSKEQLAYLEANRDDEAERWVLERLGRQRQELEACPPELARALIGERRAAAVNLAKERAKTRRLWHGREDLKERNERLERRLREVESSRTWRLLSGLSRAGKGFRGGGNG